MANAARLTTYQAGASLVRPRSVPVTAIVLTFNEEVNIARCLNSLAWCEQVIVVDSESTDGTQQVAKEHGAEVFVNPWPGFGAQRNWALQRPQIRHEWLYFLDADEWVPEDATEEISEAIRSTTAAGFAQRRRLVFDGRWIKHCGWYDNSWQLRLVRHDRARCEGLDFGERLIVDGTVERLRSEFVDEDLKGVDGWKAKHARYAELEARRRLDRPPFAERLRALRGMRRGLSLGRAVAKDIVFPAMPFKAWSLFGYMYVARLGFLDGRQGLTFCILHADHERSIGRMMKQARRTL